MIASESIADNCTFSFTCKYGENIEDRNNDTADTGNKYWYHLPQEVPIFYIWPDALTASEAEEILPQTDDFDAVSLVACQYEDYDVAMPSYDDLPTTINITVNYFQESDEKKKLIYCKLERSGWKSWELYNGTYSYQLNVQYYAYSHTALTIKFALNTFVYLSDYIILGGICLMMTGIYMLFFMIFQRGKIRFLFFGYLKYAWVPSFVGCILYAGFPQLIYTSLLGLAIKHSVFGYKLQNLWCADKKDTVCMQMTIWDYIFIGDTDGGMIDSNGKDITSNIQSARFGCLMIHAGVYLLNQSSHLMIAKNDIQREERDNPQGTDFYGNAWNKIDYIRYNFLTMCFLLLQLSLFLIHVSYSNMFGNYVYTILIGMKFIGIAFENIIEMKLGDKVMLSPISSTIGMMEN